MSGLDIHRNLTIFTQTCLIKSNHYSTMFYGRLEFSDWSEVRSPRPFIGVYRQEVIPQHYALGPILLTSLTLFTSHIQSSVRMSTYLHTAVWQITIYLRGGATLLFKITKINQKYIHLCNFIHIDATIFTTKLKICIFKGTLIFPLSLI